ncbi:MAG: sulfatase-like hydrolase/transferase [Candidatus Brocadiia bacterium]
MASTRPNVLFLFTDDQRFDAVQALANPEVRTPHMDRLVAEGTAFTHCAIMGSTIPAVCAPSRGMLLTGRSLWHLPPIATPWVEGWGEEQASGAFGVRPSGRGLGSRELPHGSPKGENSKRRASGADACESFPQRLRRAGYATFETGKWHNGRPLFARCFSGGAKIFFGGMSNHLEVPVYDFDPRGLYPREAAYRGEKFSSELFSDAAIDFLHGYSGEGPFLATVSYTAPHDPRMAPPPYDTMYDPAELAVPPNFLPEHPFDNGELGVRDELLASFPRTPDEIRRHLADYYAMVTHADEQFGRVLDALDESGHAENTIVVFAGDNGLAVGQHGLMGKQNLYEHSVRVPLVFRGPGVPRATTSHALCYLHDLYPTLCDLLGLPVPDTVESQSLAPILRGERQSVRDTLFFAYRDVQRAVRERGLKLIEYRVGGQRRAQLFDLAADPWERADLSGDASRAADLERLRSELADWQQRLDDPQAEAWRRGQP